MEDFDKSSETSPLINDSKEATGKSYGRANSKDSKSSLLSIEEINHIKKRTIKVLYFSLFIGSINFSIVMASLWPFLRKLDHTVNETFLGYVNASYSFAQMVASLVMGYWCQKRRAIEPIIASRICLAVGSLLYSYAEAFGEKGIWAILGGRIILGFSAGSISVVRAVCAQLTDNEGRAKVMAHLALWQAIGFFLGPALQALSKPIGSSGLYYAPLRLYFDIYTAPGYLMLILSIINVVILALYFVEDTDDSKLKFKDHLKQLRSRSISYEPIDFSMAIVCVALWFVAMTIFSLNETIVSPVVMNEFGWSRDKTVFYVSIFLAVAGVIAVVVFMIIAPLAKRFGDKPIVLSGYLIMLVGFVFYLPWGPGYPKIRMPVLKNATIVKNVTTLGVNLTTNPNYGSEDGGGGCPYEYSWCHTTPALSFWQFLTAATLVGIGYPMAGVILNTLYSKIIGPFPQGKYMGIYSAVGSLARVIGPVYVTAIYQHFGMRWTAASIDFFLVITVITLLLSWRRLIPYEEKKRNLRFPVNTETLPPC